MDTDRPLHEDWKKRVNADCHLPNAIMKSITNALLLRIST